MKAPKLYVISGQKVTEQAFPSRAAYNQHINDTAAQCKTSGKRYRHERAVKFHADVLAISDTGQPRPTDEAITQALKQHRRTSK